MDGYYPVVSPKRKTGAAAKQTADCTALQSQMTIEPWNHRTKNHVLSCFLKMARLLLVLIVNGSEFSKKKLQKGNAFYQTTRLYVYILLYFSFDR